MASEVGFPFSMVAWSSPRVSLGGGRATRSLEGKEVWAGERSDFRIRINLLIKEFSRLSAPLAFVPVPWWSP